MSLTFIFHPFNKILSDKLTIIYITNNSIIKPVICIYDSTILLQIHVKGFHVNLFLCKTTYSAISNSDILISIQSYSKQDPV